MKKIFLIVTISFFSSLVPIFANGLLDTDGDGVPDVDEINIYKTDINKADTDGDGYSDWVELNNGFSPLENSGLRLEEADYDDDGLTDRMELNFGTDIKNSDSDSDGFLDGQEVEAGYDPLSKEKNKLPKRIEINTGKDHELSYFLGGVKMGSFPISAGLASMPTPKGHFQIENKHPKAWSSYGLWMPYWMALVPSGRFGIHELPIWPSGYREGEDHLGQPASHGCVRVGEGPAEFLYNWAEIGTPVFIY